MDAISKIRQVYKRLEFIFLKIQVLIKSIWWRISGGVFPEPHSIPIIINNFNRLDSLKKLLHSLEIRGYSKIIILDNDSTYPPLLEFYDSTSYEVVYLRKNIGSKALWESDVFRRFRRSFYVYTDSDVVLDNLCPSDFMQVLLKVLKKYPACLKVGLGIRIDDLPDCYKEKEYAIWWESQFWKDRVDDLLFKARVDTTFALYRPFCKGGSTPHLVFRTDFPYVIQHLPWYQDTENLSQEEKYYITHSKKATFWTERLQ